MVKVTTKITILEMRSYLKEVGQSGKCQKSFLHLLSNVSQGIPYDPPKSSISKNIYILSNMQNIHNLKFGFKTQISIHSPAGVLIR